MPAQLNGKEKDAQRMRERLAAVGAKRANIEVQEDKLRDETKVALVEARGIVPMAEAARLVGLNRSTVYELYLNEGDEDGNVATGSAEVV